MLASTATSPLHWIVVDAGAITDLDFTSARVVREVLQDLSADGTGMAFAHVRAGLRPDLDRHHVTEALGRANIYDALHEAVTDLRGKSPRT